jgi:diacylglycerol kinase (ATP)
MRRVLVLFNPKSGLFRSFRAVREALDRDWDVSGVDLIYQFTQSPQDGAEKVRRALQRGTDTVLVAGGDGTVSSVGRELIGSDVALGVIPAGSGNGFARHFEIPLDPRRAIAALARGRTRRIDVGVVQGRPFLVTCSIAWDAALVNSFEKMPLRGILPYVFAGVQEFFQYRTQPVDVVLDEVRTERFKAPLVFTMANLSEYGGGAKIAPQALPDDGKIELVVVHRQDIPSLLANLNKCFTGELHRVPGVFSQSVERLTIRRARATPIQMDGELVEAPACLEVSVLPRALKILIP